ncbi:hypothetical protein KCP73_23860 [Salmonella enterica subsp. enterica]|nr:hypothetical protein KCP73_23860 [Salmonella enterica subsp. enterica]
MPPVLAGFSCCRSRRRDGGAGYRARRKNPENRREDVRNAGGSVAEASATAAQCCAAAASAAEAPKHLRQTQRQQSAARHSATAAFVCQQASEASTHAAASSGYQRITGGVAVLLPEQPSPEQKMPQNASSFCPTFAARGLQLTNAKPRQSVESVAYTCAKQNGCQNYPLRLNGKRNRRMPPCRPSAVKRPQNARAIPHRARSLPSVPTAVRQEAAIAGLKEGH